MGENAYTYEVDTSAENLERIADGCNLDAAAHRMNGDEILAEECAKDAEVIRAVSVERDALQAENELFRAAASYLTDPECGEVDRQNALRDLCDALRGDT